MTAAAIPTRVLVIDDEPAIRLICRTNLEAEGMVVAEAADGHSGLELALSLSPDAIVLDVMLPDVDGLQVARALCDDDRTRSSAIVLLTGRAELPDQAPAVGHERVVFVTKPFDPSVLVAVVRELVERRAGAERPPRDAVPGLSQVVD